VKDEAKAWARAIGAAFLIWIVLRSFLVEAFRIPSPSMENTLLVGDFLFVNKAVFGGELEIPLTGFHCCRLPWLGTPKRQDVVIFRSVEDSTPNLNIVKRVIGLPGDTLQMVHDTMIRNGQRLDEPYALHTAFASLPDEELRLQLIRAWQLPHYVGKDAQRYRPTTHDWGPIVVPAEHYFVMGDNRDQSYDSRYWGFLPRAHIRGRPLFIYMSVATQPFRIRWNRLLRHPS
jgi:signal peptidase I